MRTRQILVLFICSLVPWTMGNGLIPLLPVYATRLGADSATTGYYLAFTYLGLTVGAVAAGWLSDRFQSRKVPYILAGLAGIPVAWLMGQVTVVWGLTALTASLWFCGGLALALVSILAGLSAGEKERGKIFGILSLAGGLGAVIGGLAAGFVADRWGFPAMFSTMAAFLVLGPLAGAFLTEKEAEPGQRQGRLSQERPSLGKSYYRLFWSSLVASIAGCVILLGRSLLMSDLEFGALAISSTGAVSGIVVMPLPLLMGWLSDRAGRKIFLYLSYLAGVASLILLAASTLLWQFFVLSVLWSVLMGRGAVGNAMVTDLAPQESLGRGLALFGATSWIGAIIGFAGTGFALQNLGAVPTFVLTISLPVLAIVLLIPIRSKAQG
jgi:MFS family permease